MGEPSDFATTSVRAHEHRIEAVRFLPDGEGLVTTALYGETKLWEFRQGDLWRRAAPACVQSFERHGRDFRGFLVTPDGRLAIFHGADWTPAPFSKNRRGRSVAGRSDNNNSRSASALCSGGVA